MLDSIHQPWCFWHIIYTLYVLHSNNAIIILFLYFFDIMQYMDYIVNVFVNVCGVRVFLK